VRGIDGRCWVTVMEGKGTARLAGLNLSNHGRNQMISLFKSCGMNGYNSNDLERFLGKEPSTFAISKHFLALASLTIPIIIMRPLGLEYLNSTYSKIL